MSTVVGRDRELAEIASFLEPGDGAPRILLIEGEPGIGKTTLWGAGVDEARRQGYCVLLCTASRFETHLSFTGLRDLLEAGFDDVADELPTPQRRALDVVLLREEPTGPPLDEGAVATAFTSTLRLLTSRTPTLVAVDDLQWLDRPSALALAFAARRLDATAVRFLVARRARADAGASVSWEDDPERTSLVPVRGLTIGAVHRLVHDRLGVSFARPTLTRIHGASGGNPFFVLEIAAALQRRGPVRPDAPLPIPQNLRELLEERLTTLPPETNDALLYASATSRPTRELLERILGHEASNLDAALRAGVIETDDGRIRFTHPLYASSVYERASPTRRREVHRRLAEVVDAPEERAGHLAFSIDDPDEAAAQTLERAAEHAAAHGSPAAAADLADHASRLTPPREQALFRRLLAAGTHAATSGDAERARALLQRALEAAPSGEPRAEVLFRLARTFELTDEGIDLCRRALEEAKSSPRLRAQILSFLGKIFYASGNLPAASRSATEAYAAAQLADDGPQASIVSGELSFYRGISGHGFSMEALRQAADAEGQAGAPVLDGAAYMLAVVLSALDELDEARSVLLQLDATAREIGDVSERIGVLGSLAGVELKAGNLDRARLYADEAEALAQQLDSPWWEAHVLPLKAVIVATLGDVDEARRAVERGLELARTCGDVMAELKNRSAGGFLYLSLGDAERAWAELEPALDRGRSVGVADPAFRPEVPSAIEALIELGRLDDAEHFVDDLLARAVQLDRPSVRAIGRRCEGLVLSARGPLDAALASLERALDEYALLPLPLERARTLLALGVVQRRARRRKIARETLRAAQATFEELGAELWTAKARAELARIGGRAPGPDDLTPSERRIADLVAEGRRNKEVAALLVISTRTVESALSQIYRKLDVRSRTELARKLRSTG